MMAHDKIAIFPAAGALGGSTVNYLLDLVPPTNLILVSRKPESAPEKVKQSVATIRAADYDNEESFEDVFAGASCLNIISYPSFEHEHRSKVHKLAIDSARRSGVSHIFYSSLAFGGNCTPTTAAHVMLAHLDTENHLASLAAADPSFTYTVVRIGIYSESSPIYTAFFDLRAPSGRIRIPHDGSGPGVAWAKRDELGEAMARLIASYATSPRSFPYINKTVLLSGPRAWTLTETSELFGRLLGKPVSLEEVSIDAYAEQPRVQECLRYGSEEFLSTYNPKERARLWATAFEAIRRGETAVLTPLLASVLGREPESFDVTVGAMLSGPS